MILRVLGHAFQYEMENMCRIFFPNDKITVTFDRELSDERTVETVLDKNDITVACFFDGRSAVKSGKADENEDKELLMGRLLFAALGELTGYTPPWGVLTGIRPSKLMTKYIAEEGDEAAKKRFTDHYLVTPEKTELAHRVAKEESGVIALSRPESFSLYVSIPFCPSRCSYCSFVSHSIASPAAKKLVPEYIEKLCDELEETGKISASLGLRLESVYFGGGTPGVLEASQLDRLLGQIENSFDMSTVREYTVECGRPDTVTVPKLRTLRYHNVGRISINPQTFSQSVLDAVGRQHTVEQTLSAYRLAKSFDFDCINMDLIAGLTGDTVDGFCRSVETACELSPENITVHSLALKRSSELAASGASVKDGEDAAQMLEFARKTLTENGYSPYYMYRQSKCVGNLENVGWAKPGKNCLYNVFMMEECHTVLAAGAGAVTRLKAPFENYIERIFNFKYPYEYISRFDELSERKGRIKEFYSSYLIK